ncbi:PQQ-binding-like beta-propeller repeat protein [Nocardioides sp. cx-169]|uniref:WD40 repeat domain-containing protein n=1 Tax=Nocardioides sp. cx-169 TaxID=2899080 RepID=UPI001E3196B1|nr:PQQ-binding-like beta-propeller repeat protein [Nocardioides sp. cx-169]MCD4534249.1 PQQ-binding-like beta-propeller repeat protein [Nocardioides sp. cx-169]
MKSIELDLPSVGHTAPITSVALRRDGRLATGSYDGTIVVWPDDKAAASSRLVLRHRRLVNSVAWNPISPSILASGSADKTVGIWDVSVPSNPLLAVLSRHTDDVNSVSWMPDGRRLVCVSEDGHVTMWDTTTSRLLGNLGAHRAHCMAASVSRYGDIASVGEDGLVRVTPDPLDLGGEEGLSTSRLFDSSIEGCAWSADGELLALALDDGSLEIVGRADLETVEHYPLSTSAVRSVAWGPGDRDLIAGTYDGGVYQIDRDAATVQRSSNDRAWPRSVALHEDLVAVGSFSSCPQLYSRAGAADTIAPQGRGVRGPNAVVVSGDLVAIGTDSGEVVVLRLDDLTEVRVVKVGDSPVLGLAADGGWIFGTTYSGHVFRLSESELSITPERLGAPLPSAAVVGRRVLVGSYGGELISLDADTLEVVAREAVHEGSIKSLAALGDGRLLAASTDHCVSLLDGRAHARQDLWRHGNLVNAVAHLDGSVVASASRDRTVRVGKLPPLGEAARPQVLLGPDESIKAVAVIGTAGEPVVIAGSYDFGLYAWRVNLGGGQPGQLTTGTRFDSLRQAVSAIAAAGPDQFVVAGWDRQIRRYEMAVDGMPHVVASTTLGYET